MAIMFDVAGLAAIVAAGFVLACASRLTALLQAHIPAGMAGSGDSRWQFPDRQTGSGRLVRCSMVGVSRVRRVEGGGNV